MKDIFLSGGFVFLFTSQLLYDIAMTSLDDHVYDFKYNQYSDMKDVWRDNCGEIRISIR